ncbi:MAG: hypothetical protein JXD23_15280 [Spirochaetales bacterium]|nr:hypothetical protein [Spirochaetales bacterium]
MQLYINEEPVDFTLESEKTLDDVIRSIEQWLADRKLIISALAVDGAAFGQQDLEKRKNAPITEIGEIRVTASDFMRLEMEGVGALTSFFTSFRPRLAARDETGLAELLKGFSQAAGTLRFVLAGGEDQEADGKRSEFEKMFTGTTAGMIKLWDNPMLERAIALCDYFIEALKRKSTGYDQLDHSSKKITAETIAKLRAAAERLKEVSVLLQAGKDGEAMQTIASFTELAQLFLHVVSDVLAPPASKSLTVEGADLESYSQALNSLLHELVEAFEKKDYILIGDLCEYEIAPKIIALIDTVERSLHS